MVDNIERRDMAFPIFPLPRKSVFHTHTHPSMSYVPTHVLMLNCIYVYCFYLILAGNMPPRFEDLIIDPYRSVDSLGFIQEDIQSGNDTGNCMRAIRIECKYNIYIPSAQ